MKKNKFRFLRYLQELSNEVLGKEETNKIIDNAVKKGIRRI